MQDQSNSNLAQNPQGIAQPAQVPNTNNVVPNVPVQPAAQQPVVPQQPTVQQQINPNQVLQPNIQNRQQIQPHVVQGVQGNIPNSVQPGAANPNIPPQQNIQANQPVQPANQQPIQTQQNQVANPVNHHYNDPAYFPTEIKTYLNAEYGS